MRVDFGRPHERETPKRAQDRQGPRK